MRIESLCNIFDDCICCPCYDYLNGCMILLTQIGETMKDEQGGVK